MLFRSASRQGDELREGEEPAVSSPAARAPEQAAAHGHEEVEPQPPRQGHVPALPEFRSEERRVGPECRSRSPPYPSKKKLSLRYLIHSAHSPYHPLPSTSGVSFQKNDTSKNPVRDEAELAYQHQRVLRRRRPTIGADCSLLTVCSCLSDLVLAHNNGT